MNRSLPVLPALISLLLSGSIYATSVIHISGPVHTLVAARAETGINLDGLIPEVPYLMTCTLDSAAVRPVDMSIAPHFAPNGGFGAITLNDKPAVNNIVTLHPGQNSLSLMVSVATHDKDRPNDLILKNLDDRFSLSVKSCEAKPASGVTTAANKTMGGYFYVINHLPYFVDITVGNFFPTDYCLYPYTKQYIRVSTNNQDVDIIRTHY